MIIERERESILCYATRAIEFERRWTSNRLIKTVDEIIKLKQ